MSIRPAKRSDIPALCRICALAFYNDELFGDMMHPHRNEFPDDFEQYFVQKFFLSWWDFTHVLWVSTVEDEGREVVVGFAEWELKGNVGRNMKAGRWDLRHAIIPTLSILSSLSPPRPNRAANHDPSLRDPFPDAVVYFDHHWRGNRANSYYIDLLAIHPDFQGRGLAKELVQWGLDRAQEEGVSASVISSRSGYNFYKRMGLTTEVGMCTEGEGNPLSGLGSGWILFKDPDITQNREGGMDLVEKVSDVSASS